MLSLSDLGSSFSWVNAMNHATFGSRERMSLTAAMQQPWVMPGGRATYMTTSHVVHVHRHAVYKVLPVTVIQRAAVSGDTAIPDHSITAGQTKVGTQCCGHSKGTENPWGILLPADQGPYHPMILSR